MPRRRRSGVLTVLIVLLALVGVASLSRYGWLMTQMEWLESKNRAAVSRLLRQPEAAGANTSESGDATADVDADFIGELDIPRLNVSAAVKVGEDADVLKGAIGYIPETPLPWQPGNSAFAAHRDRIFRPLAGIHVGDEIRLSTRHGDFRYLVSHTLIVNENDVWVLDDANDVDLTLITCYPFVFVGHAPQRFVVRAKKVAAY